MTPRIAREVAILILDLNKVRRSQLVARLYRLQNSEFHEKAPASSRDVNLMHLQILSINTARNVRQSVGRMNI